MVYTNVTVAEITSTDTTMDGPVTWMFDDQNVRTPHRGGVLIRYYRVRDDEDAHDFVSSSLVVSEEQLVSGERIQQLADVVVGEGNSLTWNPNNHRYSKELTSIHDLQSLEPFAVIFVFTHNLGCFYNKFPSPDNKVIVSHNSDHEINSINESVLAHYAQNCVARHDKLTPLPIGIENEQWSAYDVIAEVRGMKIRKTKDVYFYFNLETHKSRKQCHDALKDRLAWNTKRPKKEYFVELASHRYCVCPRGNGLDTHRMWECLYLDVIPILLEADDPGIPHLPVILVDAWENLHPDQLQTSFDDLQTSRLYLSFYRSRILGIDA